MTIIKQLLLSIITLSIMGLSQLNAMERTQQEEAAECPICRYDYWASGEMQILTEMDPKNWTVSLGPTPGLISP